MPIVVILLLKAINDRVTAMESEMALVFHNQIAQIITGSGMSNQEKMGHIRVLTGEGWVGLFSLEVSEVLKIKALFKFTTGLDLPENICAEWHKELRLMKLSFNTHDYFNGGQMFFSILKDQRKLEEFRGRHMVISAYQCPYWICHFAKRVDEPTKTENKVVTKVEEPKEEVVETPKAEKPAEVPVKTIRNVKRKPTKAIEIESEVENDD